MFRKIRASLATVVTGAVIASAAFFMPAVASAANPPATTSGGSVYNNLSCGANLDTSNIGGSGTACPANTNSGAGAVSNIVTTTINILSLVVGIVAVVMLIVGGFKYITSGGDSGKVTSAKNSIVYAVIGLVVVALAQIIVQFVLTKANPNNGNGASSATPTN